MKRKFIFITFITFLYLQAFAQNGNGYINPMAHNVLLSGNFAELRSNHFHSGIDYKTESEINKPVMSIADGYVSRIGISGSGYGKVLYVTHPATGETSVYAHLNKLATKVDSVTQNYQYKNQTFKANICLQPEDLPVKQGEIIAYSGNTGSSGGPHLHFEIRDTETEDYLDPLIYKMGVTDNVKPKLFLLRVYPQKNEGTVNGSSSNKSYSLTNNSGGVVRFTNPTTIKAWGKIGLGIKCYDYSNNAANILGTRSIQVEVDSTVIFRYNNTRFNASECRYINSFIDFEEYKKNHNHIMRCFVEKGNFLRTYEDVVDQGFISINEERDYQIKFTVTDSYGNQSVFPFTIKGEKAEIPQNNTCTINMPFNTINMFETENIKVIIPKNTLYRDICFDYLLTPSDNYYSDYHQIHSEYVPLHSWCDVSIKVTKQPKDSSKLYAAKLTGGSCAYTGKYENKIFSFQTRDFGKYIIKADTIAPKITPLNISNFAASPYLSFSISDGQTGIDTYNAYIDDKWVLFEYDSKTNQIRYYLNSKEIGRSKQHQFKLVVKDAVGNESTYKRSFYW